jgi:hypothetical protein
MPDLPTLGASVAIVLLAIVMLWFALGTGQNVRRGNGVLEWLQDGLPLVGARTTLRWLGSSVAQLNIAEARTPFRTAELLVVLEPRDLGALWALARSRGRRDFLVLRFSLARPPAARADAVDPRAWTAGHVAPPDADAGGPPPRTERWTDSGGATIEAVGHPRADLGVLRDAWAGLTNAGVRPWRVSIRPTDPHLEVHVLVPDLAQTSSRRVLEAIRDLAVASAPGR